jgi:uncharacterized Zn-binding protein involved in type VI secretion
MVMRKVVVVGDKTTTNGVIQPNANSAFSITGNKAALIGNPVHCPVCKSTGTIAKAGGPRRMQFMGEVALEGDIVLCGCAEHPRLISSPQQTVTYDDFADSHGVLPLPSVGHGFDQQFHLVDESTGQPLSGQKFRITWPGGSIEGTSDTEGLTPRVTWHEAASVRIELVS